MFGQVVSGYVDPTPEGLNKAYQRHMDNLIAFEGLRQQANELKSTQFAGDVAMRRELLQTTEGALNDIVDKAAYGNLSNFTGAAYRASTEYKKRAAPIQANYQALQTYQSQVNDLLEKGKIDVEDANGAMTLSSLGYQGLQYDEEGNIGNYFTGKRVWQKPEMQDMINKALSQMSPDEFREVRTILEAGPDGSITMETDQGVKTISADKVNSALAGVLNSQEVLGYYRRKGEIRTAGLNGEQLQDYLGNYQEYYAGQVDGKGNVIPQAQAKLDDIQEAIDTQDPEKMRMEAIKQTQQSEIDTWRNAAVSGKAFKATTDIVKQDYNKKWLAGYNSRLSGAASAGLVTVTDGGIKYNRIGGQNAGDLYKIIHSSQETVAALDKRMREQGEHMSPKQRAQLAKQKKDAVRQLRMEQNMFRALYHQDPEDVLNTPEFKEMEQELLERQKRNASRAWWNPIRMIDEWWAGDYDEDRSEREQFEMIAEYLEDKGMVNPISDSLAVPIEYVDPTVLGAPKGVTNEIKAIFAGGFDSDQIVIDPETGMATTIDEILKEHEYTGDIDINDVRVSSTTPIGMGATMKIGYTYKKNDEVKRKEIIVPINNINPEAEANSGITIDALDDVYRSPAVSFMTEMLTYKHAGVQQTPPMAWAGHDRQGNLVTGTMVVDFTTDSQGGTVTVTMDNGKTSKHSLTDNADFLDYMNSMGITLF